MGKRQDTRDRIEGQIIELGRRHLVTEGAAGLSLRAIARDLGMVSSAVYRYVASRDDLLTLLLIDGYSELAGAVDRARESADGSWRDQVVAIAHAARQWAIAQPASWALLYGSPVPGYHAPPARASTPSRPASQPATFRLPIWLYPNRCHQTSSGSARSSTFPATTRRWRSVSCSGRVWSAPSAWRCSANTAPTPSPTLRRCSLFRCGCWSRAS